jgi:hypothetical protein
MNAASQYIRSATAPGTVSPENARDFPRLITLDGRRPDRPQSG